MRTGWVLSAAAAVRATEQAQASASRVRGIGDILMSGRNAGRSVRSIRLGTAEFNAIERKVIGGDWKNSSIVAYPWIDTEREAGIFTTK